MTLAAPVAQGCFIARGQRSVIGMGVHWPAPQRPPVRRESVGGATHLLADHTGLGGLPGKPSNATAELLITRRIFVVAWTLYQQFWQHGSPQHA
jgi:hypothetical protein